jgi:hypothetical protein
MSEDDDQLVSTVADGFARYDDHLKLDPDERDRARDTHHEIRDVLRSAGVIVDAFLQGSFARKTMLAPLRDIDMVVIMALAHADLLDDPNGPATAMELIVEALAAAYPDAVVTSGCHAVKINFGDGGFTFDVVPAFEVGNEPRDVRIADVDSGRWELSNTRELIRVVQERNQACAGRWVRQARMTKDFAVGALEHLAQATLPGLVSEAICYATIAGSASHADAMAAVLRAGAEMLLGPISDPTGFDVLTDDIDDDLLMAAQQAFADGADRAEEALRLAADGDEEAAVDVWCGIFGDGFPAAAAPSAHDAIDRLMAGGITSTGRPTPVRGVGVDARATRSWRSR